jgi:hypothetical protein
MLRVTSLVVLLAVVGFMYFRARDPDTWRFLAKPEKPSNVADQNAPTEPQDSAPASNVSQPGAAADSTAVLREAILPGPNGTDPEERQAFKDEAAVLTDNQPLAAEEMFAYWRLFEWARRTSFDDLWKRARKDLLFVHLFETPARHRGELVGLKLHVKRVLEHPPIPDAPEGATVFEAWGATDDSKTFPYCVIFPEKPSQLPLGDNIDEEALFAGYFLKTLQYHDKLGKLRAAPLLIGRIRWQENPGQREYEQSRVNSPWTFWVVAGGFGVFLLLRLLLKTRSTRPIPLRTRSPDESAISDWLDAAEGGDDKPPASRNGSSPT